MPVLLPTDPMADPGQETSTPRTPYQTINLTQPSETILVMDGAQAQSTGDTSQVATQIENTAGNGYLDFLPSLRDDGWNLNWQPKAMSSDRAPFNSNHANGGSPQDLPAINASADPNASSRNGYVLHDNGLTA
ncbi:MAG: hypothetical protein AAF797_00620 [Planctomycetota bacterium]